MDLSNGIPVYLLLAFSLAVILAFAAWFVVVFCRAIAPAGAALEAQLRGWMRFSYAFALGALMLCVLPFLVPTAKMYEKVSMHVLVGCVRGDDRPQDIRCDAGNGSASGQWLLTVGGMITPQRPNPAGNDVQPTQYFVDGGLAVPVYVVFLALVGGAISLTRRVPEYQKRMGADYVGTADEPKLSPEQGREYLVFQMVQFISAPFLAVVVYQLVDPNSGGAGIVASFGAGFASETLLLKLRNLLENLQPADLSRTARGSIAGRVVDAAGAPQPGVVVSLVGDEPVSVTANAVGEFVFDGVEAGRRTVEAVKGGTAIPFIVKVETGKTALCTCKV